MEGGGAELATPGPKRQKQKRTNKQSPVWTGLMFNLELKMLFLK